MSQYNTGTVAVTNGSAIVTGASTLFSAAITAGDFFTLVGDNAFYTVASVDSDSQITLAANYAGVTATGRAYTIVKDFTTNLGFPIPNQGDIETALVVKRAIEEIDSELNTAGIGGDGREWIDLKHTPTYLSASQFKVTGDRSAIYHVNRRIRCSDASTLYGQITASSFAASETTVTVALDSGSLSAALSAVALGIASATTPAITGDGIKGGTPRLDTIGEYTAGAGVTIDSVRCKDQRVENLLDPVNSGDAATKGYVDGVVVSGVYWKQPVRIATTANITLSGEQTIDGVSTSADRILVKDQSTGSENGLYVTASGAWARSADADADAEVIAGIAVYVAQGSASGDKAFTLTTDDPITLGTTTLAFAQFGGGAGVTDVTASAPITSSGGATPDIAISAATTGAAGSMSASDKTKLDGIEASATADQSNAEIKTAYEANADTNEFSDAEQTKLAGIAASANNYSHPNHTGDVTSSGDGAQTIAANAVTLSKMADMATASLLGRNTASTGDPEVLSKATALSLLNVADGAEVNPDVISQSDAEAGTATDERIWTAQRVKQAIDALASGADSVARNNIMLNAFRIAINGGLSFLNMEDGLVDEFEDETGVDTAASANQTYDGTDDFYHNPGTPATSYETGDRTGSITVTSDLTLTNPLSNFVDGGFVDGNDDTCVFLNAEAVSGKFLKFDFGVGESKVVDEAKWYQSQNTSQGVYKWQGSDNDSAWTDIGSSFTLGGVNTQTHTELNGNTTGYRYYRMLGISGNNSNTPWLREIEFKIADAATPLNMTLQSNAFTATATPTDARMVVFEEDVDSVTLNTDLKTFATRDDGRAFTTDFATDDKLDLTAHGFANTDRVTVSSATTLPAGLADDVLYYVVNATTNDFELSLTSGGAAVDITDNGTGAHTAYQWTQITLADEGDYETGKQILTGSADISGQASGTSMRWMVTTLNAKELKLHGVALQWS